MAFSSQLKCDSNFFLNLPGHRQSQKWLTKQQHNPPRPFPRKASEQPTLTIWLMTCGLGYQLMISQLSFKLQHNFNRNEAGQIVSILIFEGKLGTIPTSFLKQRWASGCSPFCKNFQKFWFGRKWKTFRLFVPLENPGKSGKSKKVGPFSRLELFERDFMFHLCETHFLCFIPVSIVTNAAAILVSHRATGLGPFWGLRSKGTTFYLSENPFFVPTEISGFFT